MYDADNQAKKLMTTDGILIGQIKKEFGSLSYDERGMLNREWLADTVFNDPEKLKKLNSLVHPKVAVDYEQWVRKQSGAKYCLKEAALLFEAGSYQMLDKIMVVTAPDEVRIKRVLQRDPHRSKTDVERIINNQIPQDEKIKMADFIIKNDESELVVSQVLKLHKWFNSMN